MDREVGSVAREEAQQSCAGCIYIYIYLSIYIYIYCFFLEVGGGGGVNFSVQGCHRVLVLGRA